MAEFGMTGATAVRYAKALLAAGSLDEFIAPEPPRKVLDLSRSELERLMREAPGGRHMNTKFAWREFGSTEGAWRVSS
jgi:predicted dienelactone hydrolase